MDINPYLIWNVLLSLVITPALLAYRSFKSDTREDLKSIKDILSKTREDYATRAELRDGMDKVMAALHRLEDKLDRALNSSNNGKDT